MIQSWEDAYGGVATEKIIEAILQEPMLDITIKGNHQKWASKLDASVLSLGSLRRRFEGRVEEMAGFLKESGGFKMQQQLSRFPFWEMWLVCKWQISVLHQVGRLLS